MAEIVNYKIKVGKPMPLGTTKVPGGINFAVMVGIKNDKDVSVILYKKGTPKVVTELVFTEEMKFGRVYAMCIQGISLNDFDYNYRIGNKVVTDPYAVLINGGEVFGRNNVKLKTSAVYEDKFDWEEDLRPDIDFSDSIIYRLHVRGFTKNKYSKVRRKGTFLGIVEKIPYLKKLGVNMVELMPAYEFDENSGMKNGKVNYWGYCDGNYFMPKVSYSYKQNPKSAIIEFKTMVKELHKNGIEVCMEFYFGEDVTPNYMIDCLRHWVINYHIDGIHCNMSEDIRGVVAADPYLTNTKIISYGFESDNFSSKKHLGESNRVFMNSARRFLKGDEGTVSEMAFRVRYNKGYAQPVNFLANNDTLTMMDMVSYNHKHNEDNGENNMDGIDDNYSWNCGWEGKTKKKSVNQLRMRQLRNAACMLFLSQGAPMIYAGDEFGNSTDGNNNPYCQDNDISYVDWRMLGKNTEYFEFVKKLIDFRKNHKILHMELPMEMKDYYSLGLPDISYHSAITWSLENNNQSRQFAVMYNGKYCRIAGKDEEENIYIAFNMHWEEQKFGLPGAGRDKEWEQAFSSDVSFVADIAKNEKAKLARTVTVPPRSVLVLISRNLPKTEVKKGNNKNVAVGKNKN